MKKINVLYVIYELGFGGVEQVLYNYISHFKNKKFQFFLLAETPVQEQAKLRFEKIGVKVLYIHSKKHGIVKYYKQLNKIFKTFHFDIIHANVDVKSFYVLLPAFLQGIRVRIAHTHRLFNKFQKETAFEKLCMYFTKKTATDLFACGNEVGLNVYNSPFYVMDNAFDVDKFEFNNTYRSKIRKMLGIDKECLVIGNIGRMEKVKNQEFLITIAKKLITKNKKIKFIVVGDGSLKQEFIMSLNENKLTSYFTILDPVCNIYEYYSAFDIFVLPSISEGLPVVGVEAQCAGTMCLFSKNITRDVAIIKENCQFIDLKNVDDWVKVIECQMRKKDINSRKEVIKRMKNSNYNIDNAVCGLEDRYRKDLEKL